MKLKLIFKEIWFSRGDLITTGKDNPIFVVKNTSYALVEIEPYKKGTYIGKELVTPGTIWYKVGNIFLHDPPTENKHSELIRYIK